MNTPTGYSEVNLDGLINFTEEDLFYKSLMEMISSATRERPKKIIKNPPMREHEYCGLA